MERWWIDCEAAVAVFTLIPNIITTTTIIIIIESAVIAVELFVDTVIDSRLACIRGTERKPMMQQASELLAVVTRKNLPRTAFATEAFPV